VSFILRYCSVESGAERLSLTPSPFKRGVIGGQSADDILMIKELVYIHVLPVPRFELFFLSLIFFDCDSWNVAPNYFGWYVLAIVLLRLARQWHAPLFVHQHQVGAWRRGAGRRPPVCQPHSLGTKVQSSGPDL